MANQYFQIPTDVASDSNDSQPVSTGTWWKKGLALSVSCLVVLAIVTASASSSTLQNTSAADSTSLLGLKGSLRSPVGGAVNYGSIIGSNPVAKLAITAIQANHLDNLGVRDVTMKAKLNRILAEADAETKEEVAKVVEAVEVKAKDVVKDMAGVTAPMGFFDPLGFSTDISEGRLLFFREAELKHGRVGMLAALGIVVTDGGFHPLFGGDINVPAYVAFQQTPLQTFWVAVLTAIGVLELPSIKTFTFPSPANEWSLTPGRMPGDFGFDPLGLKPKEPKALKEIQTKELNNGRLAMLAAAGMIAQELVDGKKITIR